MRGARAIRPRVLAIRSDHLSERELNPLGIFAHRESSAAVHGADDDGAAAGGSGGDRGIDVGHGEIEQPVDVSLRLSMVLKNRGNLATTAIHRQ